MATDVSSRKPPIPAVQPRPRVDPGAFTQQNITTMIRARAGFGRDQDAIHLPLLGTQQLTATQARNLLAALGTYQDAINDLTDEQAIELADSIVPPQERAPRPPALPASITRVPVTTTTKAPSTSKTSSGTPKQQPGPIIKQQAMATEEYRADLPPQVIPIRDTRTGRSQIVYVAWQELGVPITTRSITSPPIPFPCLISSVAFVAGVAAGINGLVNIRLQVTGHAEIFSGRNLDIANILYPGAPVYGRANGDVSLLTLPLHLLVPFAGATITMSKIDPLGAGFETAANLTCDEVDLSLIQQSFLVARREAAAGNFARQGTVNINRNRPIILTIG